MKTGIILLLIAAACCLAGIAPVIFLDLEYGDLRWADVDGWMIAAGLVYLTLVILVWTWTSTMIIRPLRRLTQAVRISLAQNSRFRLPEKSPREFQELGFALRELTETLEKRIELQADELRKQTEGLQQAVAERRLLEERARNMAMFAQANPSPILRLTAQGGILMANPVAEKLFGEAVVTTSGAQIRDLLPTLDAIDFNNLIQHRQVQSHVEKIGVRHYQFYFAGVPELQAIHAYGFDVTDGVNAETERQNLEAQVRRTQRLETIGTLAGGIAHDFNNILTPIVGYSEIALTNLPDQDKNRVVVEHVIQAAYRAKDLVNQILAFSRQDEQERKPIEIHLIVKEAVNLARASIPKSIEISTEINKCGTVLADAAQLHQIVMNLCTNAYHAIPESGGLIEVKLTSVEIDSNFTQLQPNLSPGPHTCLSVKDTGCGMDRKTIDRIFEPFFTTKNIGKGTGLGLSVVHGIVSNYGGDIIVESEPGVGTTFLIYLPIHVSIPISNPLSNPRPEGEIRRGNERILLVDDESYITEIAAEMLSQFGYQVTVRTASIEALEAYRARPDQYDLVITDQSMPKMSGTELTRKLLEINPELPIILMTGYSEAVTEYNYRKWGVSGFVLKPLIARHLTDVIRRVLDGSETIQPASLAEEG